MGRARLYVPPTGVPSMEKPRLCVSWASSTDKDGVCMLGWRNCGYVGNPLVSCPLKPKAEAMIKAMTPRAGWGKR